MMLARCAILPLLLLALSASGAHANDDALVAQWISDLDSAQFQVRESATNHLILLGPPAVPALAQAATGSSAEVIWRAVHILSEIAVAGDFDKANIAEDALAKVKASKHPSAAYRAADVLESLPQSRQTRAIEMLQSLGGRIDESGTQLHLDARWKGGDSGLRYVRHVPALRQIQVEPDAPVTDDGIKKLRSSLSDDVRITQFGSAFLGVGAVSNDGSAGMTVLTVQPNSPAAKAGLEEQDVITRIDDSAIAGFDDLVAVIRKKKVGQEVTISYLRADPDTGETKAATTKVTLGPRAATSR